MGRTASSPLVCRATGPEASRGTQSETPHPSRSHRAARGSPDAPEKLHGRRGLLLAIAYLGRGRCYRPHPRGRSRCGGQGVSARLHAPPRPRRMRRVPKRRTGAWRQMNHGRIGGLCVVCNLPCQTVPCRCCAPKDRSIRPMTNCPRCDQPIPDGATYRRGLNGMTWHPACKKAMEADALEQAAINTRVIEAEEHFPGCTFPTGDHTEACRAEFERLSQGIGGRGDCDRDCLDRRRACKDIDCKRPRGNLEEPK